MVKKTSSQIPILLVITIILLGNIMIPLQGKNTQKTPENLQLEETLSENTYDLLIIAPKQFSKYLQPLVCHKNKHEMKTKLVNVEDVYEQEFWNGRDKPEKIKYFIKDAIENWGIKYVLFFGGKKDQSKHDTWHIPPRYSFLERGYVYENGNILPEKKFLSDLYFADIYDENGSFSSWDDNNNGIFGEWPLNDSAIDIPDLKPDVFLGRLPCRTILDVKTMVKKIIDYETGSFDDSWFKKMVVIAGDTYPDRTKEYYDGEVYTQMGLDQMPDFEPVKLWTSDGSLENWRDIVKAINPGCGFVWFSGHGSTVGWSTHPPDDSINWTGRFRRWHMMFLNNHNKLPVVICGSGCFVNNFNVSLGHTDFAYWKGLAITVPSCWSWTLTKKARRGSIATIGSTAFSYESPDVDSRSGGCEQLDLGFFKAYNASETKILGECWGESITHFLDDHTINWNDPSITGDAIIVKNAQQWTLFGDPSLKIGGYN